MPEAAEEALTPEEEAALEEKRRERKEKKKQRMKEAKAAGSPGGGGGGGGGGGAAADRPVIPAEPCARVVNGSRRCWSPDDFVTLCRLGQGAFGRVMLVRWRGDGLPYAMKVVRVADCSTPAMAEQICVERRVLTELSRAPHPLLASARCCFRSARHLHFVMPFLQGGSLARLLGRQPGACLPERAARFYSAQLTCALGVLHEHGMLYLDLKLENVMLSAAGDAVLVDFGFVRCDVRAP